MGDGRDSQRFDGTAIDLGYGEVAPKLGQEVYQRAEGPDWRGGYNQVAPAYPAGSGYDQGGYRPQDLSSGPDWRGGYNQVAPAFPNGGGDQVAQAPQGGGGSGPDWRPPYNQVAPGYDRGQQNPGTQTGDGTMTPYGEVVPPWRPKDQSTTGGQPSTTAGGTDRGDTSTARGGNQDGADLRARYLGRRVSFWGNEAVAAVSGGMMGGPVPVWMSKGANWYLGKSEGMLSWVKSVRESGAPVEGTMPKLKYGVATAAERPIGWGNWLAQKWQENHGVKTGSGLKELRKLDSDLAVKIEKIEAKLKPEVDRITAKMASGAKVALTAEEQAVLSVHQFLHEGATGPIPKDIALVLKQPADVDALVNFQNKLKQLEPFAGIDRSVLNDYITALRNVEQSAVGAEAMIQRLKPQVDAITAKGAGAALTDLEKAVLEADKYLKGESKLIPTEALKHNVLKVEELNAAQSHNGNMVRLKELQALEAFKGKPVEQLPQILKEYGQAATAVDAIKQRLAGQVPDLIQKAKTGALTPEEMAVLEAHNFLKGTGQKPAADVIAKLPAEVRTALQEGEQFVAQRNILKGRIDALESELKATPRGWGAFWKNAAKGMITVSIAQTISDRLDRKVFGPQHHSSRDVINSIVIPASLFVPGSWWKKGGAMIAGSFVGNALVGEWLDSKLGVSASPGWSKFLRPTGFESALVAAAAVIPMRKESTALRLAYMGGAMLIGKTSNLLFGGESSEDKLYRANDSFIADKKERSADSMNRAIDDFKDFGKNSEKILEGLKENWLSKTHKDVLNGYRGAAIVSTAYGELRLERGTEVPPQEGRPTGGKLEQLWKMISFERKGYEFSNILGGYDIDLGGQAMRDLFIARIQIDRAKEYTKTLARQGATIKDKPVKESEIQELEKVGERIDRSLAKIYGKHDIAKIMDDLMDYTMKLNQRVVAKSIADPLRAKTANPGTSDSKYVAKLWRDLALVDLAFAGVLIGYRGHGGGANGEDATILYNEAAKALQQARALDPNNPDLPQLEQIAAEIGKDSRIKAAEQWRNPHYNPLNVDDRLYK